MTQPLTAPMMRPSSTAGMDSVREMLRQGKLDEAQKELVAALQENPEDAAVLSLMADVYTARYDAANAIKYSILAIKADSDNVSYKRKFLRIAGGIIYQNPVPDVQYAVQLCLETPGVEFEFASMLWASTLLAMPFFRQLYMRVYWRGTVLRKYLPWLKNPFNGVRDFRPLLYPHFLLGIRKTVVPNMQFERFITFLREFLLEQSEAKSPKLSGEDYLALAISVAFYAFHTDYILDVTPAEQARVDALRASVESGTARDAAQIALLGCYVPLYALKNALLVAASFSATNNGMAELVAEQVGQYVSLQKRAQAMPALTPVDDEVSGKVMGQYEVFPYPRWREMGEEAGIWSRSQREALSRPGTLALVAGCGTGIEACRLAADFPAADILAIDLSRPSLAYASEKAEKYGLKNITFGQADILKVGSLNRKFDYIQSSGVLHHMNDPERGWGILVDQLKPGGIMYLLLYSDLARSAIVAGRAAIARGNYPPTAEGMRKFRKDAPKLLGKEDMAVLQSASDYFSLNMLRDLLFHAHEDRFTVPRIKAGVEKFGLIFKGFMLPDPVLDLYSQKFPDDKTFTNLDNWHEFEKAHPRTFLACYTFLCQKKP